MTRGEIELLVKAFRAFLGGQADERFLLTNRSMELMIEHYGRLLIAVEDGQQGLLEHIIRHAADERERLLAEARDLGNATVFGQRRMEVLTETSAYSLTVRKPVPPNTPGIP